MQTIQFALCLPLLLLLGCSSPRPYQLSEQANTVTSPQEPLTRSLFDFKDRTISEEDIARILDSPIELPDTLRIALLNYSSNSVNRYYSYYWNNEEFLKLQQEYIDIIRTNLAGNERVHKVILMPRLVIGPDPNIFTLREAAVRLQADLLFVFSINSDIYYQYKVFKKNEAKAYATCEAILMDIRTGIIPYSEIVTRENLVQKNETDLNDQDTQKRAETGAVKAAVEVVSERLNGYLLGGGR